MTPANKENPIIPVKKDPIAVPTTGILESMPTKTIFITRTNAHTTKYSPVKMYFDMSLNLKASENESVLIYFSIATGTIYEAINARITTSNIKGKAASKYGTKIGNNSPGFIVSIL